jgi:hypothetical protein
LDARLLLQVVEAELVLGNKDVQRHQCQAHNCNSGDGGRDGGVAPVPLPPDFAVHQSQVTFGLIGLSARRLGVIDGTPGRPGQEAFPFGLG